MEAQTWATQAKIGAEISFLGHFLRFGLLVFFDIAQDCSLEQSGADSTTFYFKVGHCLCQSGAKFISKWAVNSKWGKMFFQSGAVFSKWKNYFKEEHNTAFL